MKTMNRLYIILTLVLIGTTVFSQSSVDSVLVQVEKNNTTLAAFRINTDAQKTGNKTGLLPSNPQVEFNYLWGNPGIIGNRIDFAVTQEFDFPTAYIYRSQIADIKNEQTELEYKKHQYNILLQARLLCSELTYLNALSSEYNRRYNNDLNIANSIIRKLDVGEATILEHNRAQTSLLNTEKKLEQINIEKNAALQQLATLNAGNTIHFTDSVFTTELLISDFEQWYGIAANNNPVLSWIKQEIAISTNEIKLQNAQNLPKLSTGYMSEKVVNQQFQGVTVGISIPLWENKNTIKYARLKSQAAQSLETDAKLQFYNKMKALHTKAVALQNSMADFKQRIEVTNNLNLLNKALEKGELSLSEYFYELMVFYDNKEELLKMGKELQNNIAKLSMYN